MNAGEALEYLTPSIMDLDEDDTYSYGVILGSSSKFTSYSRFEDSIKFKFQPPLSFPSFRGYIRITLRDYNKIRPL